MDRILAVAISRELFDVVKSLDLWLAKNLPDVNSASSAKQLPAVSAITRADWKTPE